MSTLSAIGSFLLLANPSLAQQEVGAAHRVINTVTGKGPIGNRQLATEDLVFRNEDVSAAASSRGELELMDGSKIIVGENSSITLDEFVIADDSFSSGIISVTNGAFRYISGRSKQAVTIRTPLATIGIRGTIADIYVREGGVTDAVVLQGQIIVCTLNNTCRITRRACDIIRVRSRDDIEDQPFLNSRGRSRTEQAAGFPLTENEFAHSPQWRAFSFSCSARAALETSSPTTNNSKADLESTDRAPQTPSDSDSPSDQSSSPSSPSLPSPTPTAPAGSPSSAHTPSFPGFSGGPPAPSRPSSPFNTPDFNTPDNDGGDIDGGEYD